MAIDICLIVCAKWWSVCWCHACVFLFQGVHMPFASSRARCLHLHVWEAEVKVAEAKQPALPLVASAAAVTFCPGRLASGPRSAHLLPPVVRPLTPGAPCSAHTTVLIRLIGLDLELPPVPVAAAPVTCGPC